MTEELARLHWACRRGMLELDLILLPYLKDVYPTLAAAEQLTFREMLTHPDPDLLNWLMGHIVPEEVAIYHLVENIRDYSQRLL